MRKSILLVVLTVLLLGSIALNVILFRRGQQYYLLLNAVKLNPIGLDWYESGDIPLFPNQRASITANCKVNITAIVDKASDLGAQVVVTTIFPLGRVPLERRLFWSSDVAESVDEVNDYLFSLESKDIVIFDTEAVLADEQGVIQKAYSQDLLHLTPSGYTALNEVLLPILKNLQDK
jgi:hypothetical protein